MELKNLKINFLGDSITEGHGVAQAENRFVKNAENLILFVLNFGF